MIRKVTKLTILTLPVYRLLVLPSHLYNPDQPRPGSLYTWDATPPLYITTIRGHEQAGGEGQEVAASEEAQVGSSAAPTQGAIVSTDTNQLQPLSERTQEWPNNAPWALVASVESASVCS